MIVINFAISSIESRIKRKLISLGNQLGHIFL